MEQFVLEINILLDSKTYLESLTKPYNYRYRIKERIFAVFKSRFSKL